MNNNWQRSHGPRVAQSDAVSACVLVSHVAVPMCIKPVHILVDTYALSVACVVDMVYESEGRLYRDGAPDPTHADDSMLACC